MMEIIITVLILTVLALILNARGGQSVDIQKDNNSRKMFILIACLMWCCLSALRDVTIGRDTQNYSVLFEKVKLNSWETLWVAFKENYFTNSVARDVGFYMLMKAAQMISPDYQVFLALIAVFFYTCMGVWLYRNSQMPYVSMLLFSTLFYAFFAFTGHRQTIATAIIVFIGSKYIRERKLVKFILCVLFAFVMHKSIICYVPVYFIYPIAGYSRKRYMTILLAGLLSLTVMGFLWRWVAEWLNYEVYLENETGGTGMFVFLYFVVMAIAVWRFDSIVVQNPDAYHTFNILLIGSMMVMMALVNQSFMRVQQYYTLSLMLMLPDIIVSFKGKERFLVGAVGCCLLLILMMIDKPVYQFFWETVYI